jgi:multiple sugar transport system ATP-binding protein
VGLTGFERRRVDELSGGEAQRVALARALAPRPRLLMLDEPLGSLDRALRERLAVDIRTTVRELGVAALHVTHDQDDALALGDRVAVFDRGRLAQVGVPREIYDRPATRTVAAFIGSPPMDILPGAIANEGTSRVFRLVGLDAPPIAVPPGRAAGRVEVGLRPESLTLGPEAMAEADGFPWSATIDRLEPRGHETIAALLIGPHRLHARFAPDVPYRPGDAVAVRPDLARAMWFDPSTGERIGPGPP